MTEATPSGSNQARLLELLIDEGRPRLVWENDIRQRLHEDIETQAAHAMPADVDDRRLFVFKGALETIHSCEAKWLGADKPDQNLAMTRGTVTHKAIELLINGQYRNERRPRTQVHEAIAVLSREERQVGVFLSELSDLDRDQLVAWCTKDVEAFVEDWPRLDREEWLPSAEWSRSYDQLFGGSVTLWGRFDFTLGRALGREARRLIIDFKTGQERFQHAADLRFYALLETFRWAVPPHMIGTYYLESGKLVLERVTEDLLHQAASRVADAIAKMWEVKTYARDAVEQASPLCEWCPLYVGCSTGIEFIEQRSSA